MRRVLPALIGVVTGLLLWTGTAIADGAGVGLILGDELGPIVSLEIGRSLFLRATGLAAGEVVSFVVRDEVGWVVVEVAATADGSGRTEVIEAWRHSGVVGCDCGSEVGPYAYTRVEDAVDDLVGRQLSIAVVDSEGHELVTTSLVLMEAVRPLAFPTDGTGCPRFFLANWEDLYLVVFGGSTQSACEAQLSNAVDGSPIGDQVLWEGGGPSPEILPLLQDDDTPPDLTLWFLCAGLPGVNSGLVIEDHGCPPPPPPEPVIH